ncbi:MAG: glycosyltransferase family 2 protein [Thaumarchaeota archaeon]|nr:glycosyltransferase family 2 protein [Nitrososphaerota archaeon]
MTIPEISVIMPNFNKGRYVSSAIDSVLSQTLGDLELIIVDDGSTDGSLKIVEDYVEKDVRVQLIKHASNLGAARSRNEGLRAAKSEVISFLDSDDLYAPDKLSEQMAALQREVHPCVVYCDWWGMDGEGIVRRATHDDYLHRNGMILGDLLTRSFNANALIMAPSSCFKAVGFYDESLVCNEDYDLVLRLAAKFPFRYVPRPLYGYRIYGGNTLERVPRRLRYNLRASVVERNFLENESVFDSQTKVKIMRNMLGAYAAARNYRKLARHGLGSRLGISELARLGLRSRKVQTVFGSRESPNSPH